MLGRPWICLLALFLVACASTRERERDEPVAPDAAERVVDAVWLERGDLDTSANMFEFHAMRGFLDVVTRFDATRTLSPEEREAATDEALGLVVAIGAEREDEVRAFLVDALRQALEPERIEALATALEDPAVLDYHLCTREGHTPDVWDYCSDEPYLGDTLGPDETHRRFQRFLARGEEDDLRLRFRTRRFVCSALDEFVARFEERFPNGEVDPGRYRIELAGRPTAC